MKTRNEEIAVQVRDNDRIRDDSGERTTRKTILQNLEPEGKFLLIWNVTFIVSCMIAVSLDPLFFYLPVINEDRKCLALDTKLKIIANLFAIDEDERKLGRTREVTDAWPIAKRSLWSYFIFDILAILPLPQVPLLERNERLLQRVCGFLKPVYYNKQSHIVREGEPLDATLFITQGIVWSFTTGNNGEGNDSSEAEYIGKGDFYGQDLLDWAFNDSPISLNLSKLPISKKTVKTHAKVEGFALMANNLKTVVSNWRTVASALRVAWQRRHGR
ncbi:cyclic nucleotide-gated ion channel 1 [Quercus suber]|uniref:Cyclic nucleotide-gated ion channel 1 n=1 Tax=Quercus suber TaxID=58331 RepID=A0AAW0L4H0_QUESU